MNPYKWVKFKCIHHEFLKDGSTEEKQASTKECVYCRKRDFPCGHGWSCADISHDEFGRTLVKCKPCYLYASNNENFKTNNWLYERGYLPPGNYKGGKYTEDTAFRGPNCKEK